MMNPLDQTPHPHPTAAREQVGDRLVVATPDDLLHEFVDDDGRPSEVAELIAVLADGTRTVRQLAGRVCAKFEVGLETAQSDTLGFVRLLVARGILTFDEKGSMKAL